MPAEKRYHDIGLVSYLLTKGYRFDRTEREGRRTFWIFSNEIPEAVVVDYYQAGEAPARVLFDTLRSLKRLTDEIL